MKWRLSVVKAVALDFAGLRVHVQFDAVALGVAGLDFVMAIFFQLDFPDIHVTGGFHAVMNLADIQGGRGGLGGLRGAGAAGWAACARALAPTSMAEARAAAARRDRVAFMKVSPV